MATSLVKTKTILYEIFRWLLVWQSRKVGSWLDLRVSHVPCTLDFLIRVIIHHCLLHKKVVGYHFGPIAFGQLQPPTAVWRLRPILAVQACKWLFSASLDWSLIFLVLCAFVLHKLFQNFDWTFLYLDRPFGYLRSLCLVRLVGIKLVSSIVHLKVWFPEHFFH